MRRLSLTTRISLTPRRRNGLSVAVAQGVSGWTGGDNAANTTLVQNAALGSADGGTCLSLTAIGAGTIGAMSPKIPVAVAQRWLGRAEFRAATVGRSVGVYLEWHTSGGVYIGGSYAGAFPADTTSGWTTAQDTAVIPAGAGLVSIQVLVTGVAAGEIHYVDKAAIYAGADATWTGV